MNPTHTMGRHYNSFAAGDHVKGVSTFARENGPSEEIDFESETDSDDEYLYDAQDSSIGDQEDEVHSALSAQLRRLLGLQSIKHCGEAAEKWERPDHSGLSNSERKGDASPAKTMKNCICVYKPLFCGMCLQQS